MARKTRMVAAASVVGWTFLVAGLAGQQSPATQPSTTDLRTQPTLYVVPYAHLDTEWRWDYATTIREYLSKTIRDNLELFDKYPNYVFNFSGANRYRMFKEYYPADYEKVKRAVASGRWFPSGSSMEENDVNAPSAESNIRQILYGKQFFRREFGKTSAEFMLPDCFGFPASLPSILAHAGIKGFSTQKLSWNSAMGIPFNVGFWEGPDGKGVVAALNAMNYNGDVRHDLSKTPPPVEPASRIRLTDWAARIEDNAKRSGLALDYSYYGTGDTGGSPREPSIALMEAIVTRGTAVVPPLAAGAAGQAAAGPSVTAPAAAIRVGDGPVRVIQTTAERMFLDIPPEAIGGLPRYSGDLLLIEHSAGSITSQAYLKRWNRMNETLSDAAEKASVAAHWLGARAYPLARLNEAWTLVMGGQFHDILPGTSIPKAYEYAWNDQVLALNQFASVLTDATDAVSGALNTQTAGTPVVVFNPLNIAREDVVEAALALAGGPRATVRVVGPDGREVPSQVTSAGRILFLAKVPSAGYAVFDVQAGPARQGAPRRSAQPLGTPATRASESELENGRYLVKLDANGDISSLFDKKAKRELLAAPIRLAIKTDKPVDWPAWNMDWADQQKPPRAFVSGPAEIRVIENGPVRVAVEIARKAEGSSFVQTVRLSAGDAGNRVEFANVIDWKTAEANLKATFTLAASNPEATYNWDIGTVRRGNNHPKQFEVPSHQWFDLTETSGAWGVTVLSDAKLASDKPDDRTVRLTLMRTPGIGTGNGGSYADQATQDWGRHEFVYGLAGHTGDWRADQTDWQALRLNQPLLAFEASKHPGSLGRAFSLFTVSHPRVRALAVKKAEQSDEVIVRLVEMDGRPAPGVRVSFAAPLSSAREVNGAEEPVGSATIAAGALAADFSPYQVRSFAVRLVAPAVSAGTPPSVPVALDFDQRVASPDRSVSAGSFDGAGRSLPAEMLPPEIAFGAIRFALAPPDKRNAVAARGQAIDLPAGGFTRLYLLAAADGEQKAAFEIGATTVDLTIGDWGGYIGQWDNRTWNRREEPVPPRPDAPALPAGTPPRMRTVMDYTGLVPGYIKRTPVAWFASHRHAADGTNDPYAYSYLFAYSLDIPPGATTLTLPVNPRIKILAIAATNEGERVRPAQPLYDTLER
jgi:alpha-mannosidase